MVRYDVRLSFVMAIPRFFQHTVNGCGVNGFPAVLCNLTFMAIWEERLRQGPSHPVSPVLTQKFTAFQQTAFSQLHASISTFFWDSLLFLFFHDLFVIEKPLSSITSTLLWLFNIFHMLHYILWGHYTFNFHPFKQILVSLFKVYKSAKETFSYHLWPLKGKSYNPLPIGFYSSFISADGIKRFLLLLLFSDIWSLGCMLSDLWVSSAC